MKKYTDRGLARKLYAFFKTHAWGKGDFKKRTPGHRMCYCFYGGVAEIQGVQPTQFNDQATRVGHRVFGLSAFVVWERDGVLYSSDWTDRQVHALSVLSVAFAKHREGYE